MIVLAIDTATDRIVVGVVAADPGAAPRTLAERHRPGARAHNEVAAPLILECLAEAGLDRADIDAVVVGRGPGPFTGLRVGMATAAAFADALGLPLHGVRTPDAMAPAAGEALVIADARRREVYHARYRDGALVDGPGVCAPGAVPGGAPEVLVGSAEHAAAVAAARGWTAPVTPAAPTAAGLVAAADLAAAPEAPPTPLYLRRPDATPPAPRPASPALVHRGGA